MSKDEDARGDNPHEGHRQRLKDMYMENGSAMMPHQKLELLLTYALPRRDVNPLAHRLIALYGSLSGVLEADPHELEKIPGVGRSTAILLSLSGELARTGRVQTVKRRLKNPADAMTFCRALLDGEKYEAMYLISLDKNLVVLHTDRLSGGTLTETVIYPRIAVECALRHRAHSVILTHNHPSGDVTPSKEDIETTRRIVEAFSPIGVAMHDHIIIGGESAYSMMRDEKINYGSAAGILRAAEKES